MVRSLARPSMWLNNSQNEFALRRLTKGQFDDHDLIMNTEIGGRGFAFVEAFEVRDDRLSLCPAGIVWCCEDPPMCRFSPTRQRSLYWRAVNYRMELVRGPINAACGPSWIAGAWRGRLEAARCMVLAERDRRAAIRTEQVQATALADLYI